ncbi:hypothetical protein OESDEN_14263, partial [Oesophagostomum dentatum]
MTDQPVSEIWERKRDPKKMAKQKEEQGARPAWCAMVSRRSRYYRRRNGERSAQHKKKKWTRVKGMMKTPNLLKQMPTGEASVQHSRPRLEQLDVDHHLQDTGQAYSFLAFMQANTCVNPGVFRGSRHEDFKGFIRRFGRRYRGVIKEDKTLSDDHLEGRAKTIFLSLPRKVREQGFGKVVEELRRLSANDSLAGRLCALTELRNLKKRPGQSVSEFCVVLEKLGRKANPTCPVGDRSLEYAQILLDNLTAWPEHIQLLSALHNVKPQEAYNAVKQLALSIEQSKEMFGEQEVVRIERESRKKRARVYEEREHRQKEGRGNVERLQVDIRNLRTSDSHLENRDKR